MSRFDEWCEDSLPDHIVEFLDHHRIRWFGALQQLTPSDLLCKGMSETDIDFLIDHLPYGVRLRNEDHFFP